MLPRHLVYLINIVQTDIEENTEAWPSVMGIHRSPVDSRHKGPGFGVFFNVSLRG